MEITREKAEKVLKTVDAGLVSGVGDPIPGKMCVQAAVCYAFGLPHGDDPTCVGSAVKSYMIRLNDAKWGSDEARTKNMRKLSIAQLGSDSIDQRRFAGIVVEGTARRIVPMALRFAGSLNEKFAAELEVAAKKCEISPKEELRKAVIDGGDLARKVQADAYAAYAAATAAYAAAASYAAYAAAAAAYAADASDDFRIKILQEAVQIGMDALVECKSPGCAFLDLCD